MGTLSKFASTAALALATTLVLSCSSDDGGGNNSSGDGASSGGGASSPSGGNVESVTIGSQVWMKKNLDVAGGKCYDDLQANCDKYGALYDWATAKTACPSGWHLPDTTEWNTLVNYVETSCTEPVNKGKGCPKALKATSGWDDYEGASGNGDNASGFAALPGGYYYGKSSEFRNIGVRGLWWSSYSVTEGNETAIAAMRLFNNNINGDYIDGADDTWMCSVRCIKD